MYLKYATAPKITPRPSYLLLNATTSAPIFVALRKRDGLSRPEGQKRENMRVNIDDDIPLQLDGVDESSARQLERPGVRKVSVELDGAFGVVGEPQAELVVAMPPTVFYRIPLALVAIDGRELQRIAALCWILLVMNLVSVGLALHAGITRDRVVFIEKSAPNGTE
jgi:hypothetical protein